MGFVEGYPGSCPVCRTPRAVSGTYDAALCVPCDTWQSPLCAPTVGCEACQFRPATPSQAADLDLAPDEAPTEGLLSTRDEAELLRQVLQPVVIAVLPAGVVQVVTLDRRPGWAERHWPQDVPRPAELSCAVVLMSGERLQLHLAREGWVDPVRVAEDLGERLADEWCESRTGWGQQLPAR